jgi:catechol 2,3-dioxygenase-like lactoylglutathione lyase family enzyme
MVRPPLVPELSVTDCAASLAFWCDLCGFSVLYDRPEDGFAKIGRDGAEVMLDQIGIGRDWTTGPLERPLGRGLNLEIAVADLTPILGALSTAGWPLFMTPEEKRYRVGSGGVTVRQFLVQDPDGYLLRFQQVVARD